MGKAGSIYLSTEPSNCGTNIIETKEVMMTIALNKKSTMPPFVKAFLIVTKNMTRRIIKTGPKNEPKKAFVESYDEKKACVNNAPADLFNPSANSSILIPDLRAFCHSVLAKGMSSFSLNKSHGR